MRRSWTSALVFLAASCAHSPTPTKPAATPERPATLEEAIASTHRALAERVAKQGWPDFAAGVVIDGKLVYAEGFGVTDPNAKAPVTPYTLFRIGSVTKLFTGMAILKLRDEGKLDLDDPVSKYIPEISRVVYPTAEHPPIRIRHLLTHTSGLPHDDPVHFFWMTEAQLVADLDATSLEFTPGSGTGYSNLGLSLAGVIISRTSGLSYRTYMRQQILEPMGMTESVWEAKGASRPVAAGMSWDDEKRGFQPIREELVMGAEEPAGGLYSNLNDMAKFAAFEMSAWPPRSDPESPPLSRSSLRESQQSAGPGVPGHLGVAWGVFNDSHGQLNSHAGGLGGYHSEIDMWPRRHVAVFFLGCEMSDQDSSDTSAILAKAFALLGQEPPPPPKKPSNPDMQAAVARLVHWLDDPHQESAKTVFAPDFVERVPELAKIAATAAAEHGGNCRVAQMTEEGGVNAASVELTCKTSPWSFQVRMQPHPPHLLTGWHWQ
jgi:CubicO group peptidase (beta-lactamase class C family)